MSRIRARSGLGRAGLALLLAVLPAAAARAHVVYGKTTVYRLVLGADLVARARIVDPAGVAVLEEPPARRPVVVAELLEVYKGEAAGRVRFAQHGHGVARYEAGEEAVLFLRRTEHSRELAQLAAAVAWVSLQEHDHRFALTAASRPAFAAAVRAYVALEAAREPAARLDSLRRLTFELLRSPEPRLAASALGDLVAMGGALVTAGGLSALEPLIDDPAVAIGVRLGVLAELERQGLVAGPPRWARLLRTAAGPELLAAVRAAGAHPSPPVVDELLRLLASGDPETAAAAAMSLGVPGNQRAVVPLTGAVETGAERVRMAAIRGLGRIATAEARDALRRIAATHPDAATRRRARAEVARSTSPTPPPAGA